MSLSDVLATTIERVAGVVAREYPGVDRDDIKQELHLFVLTAGKGINPDEESGTRYILTRAAHIYARRERAQQLGDSVQYAYRPDDVRRVLETMFSDVESWQGIPTPDDYKSIKPSSDSLDFVADVQRGLGRLDQADVDVIASRYLWGYVPDNGSAERKRLDRAVLRLVDAMNTYAYQAGVLDVLGRPGTRQVITNAQADYLIASANGA